MFRILRIAVLAFLALASPAIGADLAYLPPDALNLSALLPPPPAQNSAQTQTELAEIHRLQTEATAEERRQAGADVEESPFVYASVMGPGFTRDNLPIAAPFLERALKEEALFVDRAKMVWLRPRPPYVDHTIKTCQKPTPSGAYPSGHAATGYLMAEILAQIVPEKREAIFQRAAQYAHNRILCGVHYASDVEAGKTAGLLIAEALKKNAAFQADLAPARAEIRRALGLPQ